MFQISDIVFNILNICLYIMRYLEWDTSLVRFHIYYVYSLKFWLHLECTYILSDLSHEVMSGISQFWHYPGIKNVLEFVF